MLRLRKATLDDVRVLREMILEFADFEKLRAQVKTTEESIARDGFGEHALFRALIAEWDGKIAGYAIYFVHYSSFEGQGLFLEDVYVRDGFRGKGIGKAVMAEVAAIAIERGFGAMRWEVLDWNQPAIAFYEGMGATFLHDRKAVQIEGDALRGLAALITDR
jgi:GNAT superfamily N-acetyltransferase